jgi:hypothetical protein
MHFHRLSHTPLHSIPLFVELWYWICSRQAFRPLSTLFCGVAFTFLVQIIVGRNMIFVFES